MIFNKIQKSELFRYVLVGGGAVFIDLLIYLVLVTFIQQNPSWAKRISFICGGIWSFLANKFFTFRAYNLKVSEPLFFIIIYSIGFLLNTFSHDAILKLLHIKLIAFGIATGISIIWNYAGQKWLVFRV